VLFGVGGWKAACFAFSASEEIVLSRRKGSCGVSGISMRNTSAKHGNGKEKRREKWDVLETWQGTGLGCQKGVFEALWIAGKANDEMWQIANIAMNRARRSERDL